MFSGYRQQVVLDPVHVLSSVHQGSVLGRILYFLHNITYQIISSIRFACSQRIVSCKETFILCKTLILQEDLNSLALWEANWQMKFNVDKCHSMRVTRHYSYKHILHDYTLHQQNLENVHLRNEFNFWKVHGIKNTSGRVQSK